MKRFRGGEVCEIDSLNMANVLLLFSSGVGSVDMDVRDPEHQSSGRVFECKTCSRRFPSFQALGGHRASHKKPRLAGTDPAAAAAALALPQSPAKPRVHECSVCGLEFSIGQALGGHMRRHRSTAPTSAPAEAEKKAPPVSVPRTAAAAEKRDLCLGLDLNLPPSENDKNFLSLGFGRASIWSTVCIDLPPNQACTMC